MSISYWLKKQNESVLKFDFCIVGGGIAGVSTAFWLEKKFPLARIAIVERHKMGFGASGRNAGFVTCGSAEHFSKLEKQFGASKAGEIWRYSEENRELLQREIIQSEGESIQFLQTGSCTVAPSPEDWLRYQEIAAIMQRQSIDVQLIQDSELQRDYGVRNFSGAIEYKQDGVIHPIRLLKKIFSKLKNTQIFENEEIYHLESGALWGETNCYKAEKIFITVNGFLPLLCPELKDHIVPQRGQILVTNPLPQFVKGPCYLTKHLCYFRQLPGGELLVGGFRNVDLENENTFHDQISEKIQAALLDFTKNYFSVDSPKSGALPTAIEAQFRWSGIMGFTKDGQMLIGEHPKLKNVHLMAGCSGHGMGLSFHAAKTMVESLLEAPIPTHLNISRLGF